MQQGTARPVLTEDLTAERDPSRAEADRRSTPGALEAPGRAGRARDLGAATRSGGPGRRAARASSTASPWTSPRRSSSSRPPRATSSTPGPASWSTGLRARSRSGVRLGTEFFPGVAGLAPDPGRPGGAVRHPLQRPGRGAVRRGGRRGRQRARDRRPGDLPAGALPQGHHQPHRGVPPPQDAGARAADAGHGVGPDALLQAFLRVNGDGRKAIRGEEPRDRAAAERAEAPLGRAPSASSPTRRSSPTSRRSGRTRWTAARGHPVAPRASTWRPTGRARSRPPTPAASSSPGRTASTGTWSSWTTASA